MAKFTTLPASRVGDSIKIINKSVLPPPTRYCICNGTSDRGFEVYINVVFFRSPGVFHSQDSFPSTFRPHLWETSSGVVALGVSHRWGQNVEGKES